MLKKILKVLFTVVGGIIGYVVAQTVLKLEYINNLSYIKHMLGNEVYTFIYISIIIFLSALLMFFLSPLIITWLMDVVEKAEHGIQKHPANEIIFGTIGVVVGLIISTLFLNQFKIDSIIWTIFNLIITVVIMIICADVAIKRKEEIMGFTCNFKRTAPSNRDKKNRENREKSIPKVLDTSVIIDGRILDICKTGFVEGPLVIPQFILEELRHIADSSDDLKRVRGRRGLDILNSIQNDLDITVDISEMDFPEIKEVDSKLLKLAQHLNGKVITNDFNLNKVAQFQGVEVLNINELANSIKPILLPGESMMVQLVKSGKENGQGIAYLDDGTMIVVEGGKKYIGDNIKIEVTSALQTAAGRMIFGRVSED